MRLLRAVHDFDTDVYYLQLHTSSYSPDEDAHDFADDLTNEITGTGYTAGGREVENMVVSQDNTNNRAVVDSDDVSWSGASFTARQAVMRQHNGGASSADPLVGCWDYGSNITASGGTFIHAVNASGWFAVANAT